jgi:hypothetical protein
VAIEHVEWLNQNAHRRYPLAEDTPLGASEDPGYQVPGALLVGFSLAVADDQLDEPVYLRTVAMAGNIVSLAWTTGAGVPVTSLVVNLGTHARNQGYGLIGADGAYAAARGRAIIGDPAVLRSALAPGEFTFAARMEFTTVYPSIRGVQSLVLDNAGVLSPPIYGRVKLVSGSNIRLSYDAEHNAVRIDAISGIGLNADCECDDLFNRPCIQTVNGINVANLQLEDDGCIEIVVSGNRIKFSNPCASPCCGCEELLALVEAIKKLEITDATLRGAIPLLHARLSDLGLAMLFPP